MIQLVKDNIKELSSETLEECSKAITWLISHPEESHDLLVKKRKN